MSLVVSGIQPVIDFGWMMTTGIALAMVLSFVIVPCMILVWPAGKPHRHTGTDAPLTALFAGLVDRQGRVILGVTAVLVVLTIVGISRLQVENRFIDYFDKSTEIYKGMELLDSDLGGTIPLDIILAPLDMDKPLPGLETAAAGPTTPVAEDDFFAEDVDDFGGSGSSGGSDSDEWDDEFGSDGDDFATSGESFQPSYWFSLEGMRELDAVHNYVDARPETGKVLSLSTVFAVVKNLLGNDIGSVELAIVQKSLPEDVSAMMVDPYFSRDREQARVTVRVKETSKDLRRDEFLRELRQITRDSGSALILDEIVTGFRVHQGGIQKAWGIEADIVTYGKIVGGGMPIGIVAGKAAFMNALDGGQWQYGDDSEPEADLTFFAGTFIRHPLAMAAAYAAMRHLLAEGPQLQERVNQRTTAFVDKMNAFFENVQVPIRLRHYSSWFRFDYPADLPYMELIAFHLLTKGVYVLSLGQNFFFSTQHSDDDIAPGSPKRTVDVADARWALERGRDQADAASFVGNAARCEGKAHGWGLLDGSHVGHVFI